MKQHSYLATILIPVFGFLFLCVCAGFAIKSYFRVKGEQDAIAGGIIVKATYISIQPGGGRNTSDYYHVWYEFYDENGIRYSGLGLIGVTEDEARAAVGKTVNIYIDGKGHSIAVGEKANSAGNLILSIVLTFIIVASLLSAIIFYFRSERPKKRKKKHQIDMETDTTDESNQ
ncbi:MAG: hypothetical protein LBL66_04640 [Clostridiales bacterium]|jgi:hypothetical protein|nr:hypothetical protein [Clostridiales bacterium]